MRYLLQSLLPLLLGAAFGTLMHILLPLDEQARLDRRIQMQFCIYVLVVAGILTAVL